MNKLLRHNHLLKNTTIAILFAIASFLFALPNQGFAQQVFPVLVNGSLVPPHSLAIEDYAFDKSEDIMFFVTLNDPIEQMRAVRFRLTIMSDGQDILVTNPNFLPPPIILEKDIMQMINGADLAAYFNPLNLVRVDGGGAGNGLLPSGFNSFCLEVIDVEREVPISDKFCASGIFELAQPPILNTPFCHADISIEDTPNMLFSWTAMHQLSLNQPTSVEYEFTLIKLLPGVADPNDGFNFAIPVFQTTQAQTVLYYYEDNPLLESGETYAWRVRALDIFGNDVFQNDGYSDICTFTVTGETLPPDGGETDAFACGDGGCDWNGTLSNEPFSGNISEGDKIKVGNFKMRVTQISDNGGTYSGEGTIYIPFLFSKLKVAFNNISINQDGRVFNGQISSTTDNDSVIPSMFSLDNMGDLDVLGAAGNLATEVANNFSDATASALENHFDGSGQTNLVSFLKDVEENSAIPIGLPIGIDKTIEETNSKLTIAITGIKFTPIRANLNAVLMTKFEEGGEYLKFGARGICFQPGGIAAPNPILELLTDADLSSTGVPLTLVGMEEGESRTYLSFDCNGFEEFSLTGRHEFDNEIIFPKGDPEGKVIATVQGVTRSLTDFIATADPIGDFQFKGAEDFTFTIGEMSLDLSAIQNPEGIEFPEEFPTAQANETFKGFFLSNASVELPDVFNSTTNGALPKLIGTSVLYTTDGFTGNLLAENLINIETGDLGGWAYSLDSAYLKIVNNGFTGSGFNGQMRLPIMSETESMKYLGSFIPSDLGMDINFAVLPDLVSIDLLRAQFQFDSTSQITIGRQNGQFQKPKVDLNGMLRAYVPEGDPGFLGEIMTEIQGLIDNLGIQEFVPKLDMEGIRFDGLKIDLDAANKFQIGSITPVGVELDFLGLDCDISGIGFNQLSVPDLTDMNISVDPGTIVRAMDFNMDFAKDLLGIGAPKIRFSLVINELPNTSGSLIPKFEFGGFDLSFSAGDRPSFDCGADIEPIVVDVSAGNLIAGQVEGAFETLKIGHFDLTPTTFTKDENGVISGQGTVQVPILGPLSNLGVSFENVKVDLSGRIVEGEVITDSEAGLFNSPELGGLLSNVQGAVDGAVSGINDVFQLPVIMGLEADGDTERDQGLILVGLSFSPTEAKAQAKVVFEIGTNEDGTTKYAEFKAEGLTLVPDGVANFDLKIGLGADLAFQPMEGFNPLVFKAFETDSGNGSYVSCDCSGFLEFQLEGEYEFSQEQLVSLDDPNTPVKAAFKFSTQKWGEFVGNMQSMGNFTVPGLDGFDFVVSDAYLDFSKERDLSEIVFPNEYIMPDTANHWRGFFIKEIGLTLPEDFVLSEGGERPFFNGQNLLIDPQGVSASISGNNVLQGEIDGWAFNLDSIGVNILTNNLVESAVKGSVGIPLIDDPMPYVGTLVKDSLDFYQMKLMPDGDTRLNIAALKSYIDIGENTEIVLQSAAHPTIANKTKFTPYANLWGGVGISVTNDDFNNPEFTGQLVQDAKTVIEDLIGVPLAFIPPAITFEGLKINHPTLPDTSRFGLDNYAIEGGIKIGDYELSLKDLKMLESAAMDFKNNGQQVSLPGVGLSFSLGIPLINIDVQFWAKEQVINGKEKFSFGKIMLNTTVPKFSCEGGCPEAPTDQTTATSAVNVGDTFTAGDFKIEVTAPGKGETMVGFLNTKLNVDFENIQLNAAGELISGTVTTVKDGGLFAGDLIQVGVEGESIQLPLMDELTNAVDDFAKLPFSLNEFIKKAAEIEDDLPFDFVVVGLRFTPTGAKMDAAMMFKTPGDAVLKFGATGLCFTQQGVNLDQIKVYLAEEITLDDIEFPLTILPGNSDGDDGSYATFSCTGVENFHLQAKYDFPTTQLTPVDPALPNVAARFTIESETWGQFMATASIDEFMIEGVDDVTFKVTNAAIDYSDTSNPDNFPDNYFTVLPNPLVPTAAQGAANGNNIWRGFFLEEVSVGLPESFSLQDGGRITLEGTDLIYDKGNGLTARLAANNLLKLKGESGDGETGDLAGWAFSIEQLLVKIKFNSLDTFSLDGKIHIPVTAQGDEIAYTAAIGMDDQNKPTAQFTLSGIDKEYSVPFLDAAKMNIAEGSVVGIKYDAGGFQPYSDVSGSFSLELESPEFKLDALTFENFKINDFDMPAPPSLPNAPKTGGLKRMSFKGFKFAGMSFPSGSSAGGMTASNSNTGGTTTPSTPASTNKKNEKMGGFPINITNIKFASITENGEDLKKLSFGLGVNFSGTGGGGIAGNGDLAILGKLNIGKLTSEPWKAVEFKGIDVGSILIKGDLGPVAFTGGLVFIKNDPVYGEGFKGLFDMRVGQSLRLEAVGQFGITAYDHRNNNPTGENYRYFFVDAKGTFFPGVGAFGVAVYGFGGGLFYNMSKEDLPVAQANFTINEEGGFEAKPVNNQPMTAPLIIPADDARLEPGVALSGTKYYPSKGSLGLKATVIAGLQNPQILNAEATLGIEFGYSPTLGVSKIYFEGSAYALCSSILEKEDASIKGNLRLDVDFINDNIHGDMDFTVNTPVITGTGTGSMKFPFNGFTDPLKEPWHIHLGTPNIPLKINYKIPVADIQMPGVEAYFMAGHNLPNPVKISLFEPALSAFDRDATKAVSPTISNGKGVAFGARLRIPRQKYKVAIFTASFTAGAGFDVSIQKYDDVFCGSGNSLVGLEGWYLKGNAYAYLSGKLDMYVDVWVYEGNVNLMELTVAAQLQAQLPNPTWLKADIMAKGSVLDGLIKVNKRINVEIGKRCEGLGDVNPLADISIITDFQPNDAKNETNIPVYYQPRVAFSRYVSKDPYYFSSNGYLRLVTVDDSGNDRVRYFAPYLKGFEIRKNDKNGTWVGTKGKEFTNFNKSITLTPRKILAPYTWYYTAVEIGWKEYNYLTKKWYVVYHKGKAVTEKRTAKFKTGGMPDRIVKDMLSYHAPGDRQRNWHRNYADPMLEFKQSGWGYLFDRCQEVRVGNRTDSWGALFGFGKYEEVCYDYKYQLTNLNTGTTKNYPLSSYPRKDVTFSRTELTWVSILSGIFKIPTYKTAESQGTKVDFGTMNNSGRLDKNSVYKLEILGVPLKKTTANDAIASEVTKNLTANSNFTVTKVESTLKQQKKDPTKENRMLYEYHFKTSKYNSLKDKLAALTFIRKSKGAKRSDLGHPNMEASYRLPSPLREPDDYYLYRSDEGFDKFDRERLRNNVYLNHRYYANRHPFETPLYYAINSWNIPYWDYMKSHLSNSDIYKNITINGERLYHSWQLKKITDYIMRPYWYDDDYGMRIQFPNVGYYSGKVVLSDWDIDNPLEASSNAGVACSNCNTKGYSTATKWDLSLTIARRRIMMSQWGWNQFIASTSFKYGKAFNIFGETNPIFYYCDNLYSPYTGGGPPNIDHPFIIYYMHWGNNYMNSNSPYYKQYSYKIDHTRYRKKLSDMKFIISYSKPSNRWRKMQEKASREANKDYQIYLKDGMW